MNIIRPCVRRTEHDSSRHGSDHRVALGTLWLMLAACNGDAARPDASPDRNSTPAAADTATDEPVQDGDAPSVVPYVVLNADAELELDRSATGWIAPAVGCATADHYTYDRATRRLSAVRCVSHGDEQAPSQQADEAEASAAVDGAIVQAVQALKPIDITVSDCVSYETLVVTQDGSASTVYGQCNVEAGQRVTGLDELAHVFDAALPSLPVPPTLPEGFPIDPSAATTVEYLVGSRSFPPLVTACTGQEDRFVWNRVTQHLQRSRCAVTDGGYPGDDSQLDPTAYALTVTEHELTLANIEAIDAVIAALQRYAQEPSDCPVYDLTLRDGTGAEVGAYSSACPGPAPLRGDGVQQLDRLLCGLSL